MILRFAPWNKKIENILILYLINNKDPKIYEKLLECENTYFLERIVFVFVTNDATDSK